MKNYKLLLGSALLTGAVLFSTSLYFNTAQYTPRTTPQKHEGGQGANGAAEWLFNLQKNPLTGTIDPIDVLKAREQVMQSINNRSAALGLNWTELGPDNIGGRTRAIIFDKNNPNKMFAAGVAGGLWVSTNSGTNWSSVAGFDQQANLAIVSMTQAANGDIYVGTGEASWGNLDAIKGFGIYKSTDGGTTFNLLSSTKPTLPNTSSNSSATAFIGVSELAADPVNANRIYAATLYGLQMTDDGGLTWTHPIRLGNGNPNLSQADDVDVASDGTVITVVSNKLYTSPNGDYNTFTATATGLPAGTSISRMELAVAPSDPNFMYALVGKYPSNLLEGVYQSTNKGQTWLKIGNGGSTQFEMFQSLTGQAWYDIAITVNPADKYKIFTAGVIMWTWRQNSPSTPGVGQWTQAASNGFNSPSNPYFVHSDIHELKFKNATTLYVGCDGGIFRSQDAGVTYQAMNNGFNIAQLYSLAFEGDNPYGSGVVGGLQDNGTQYLRGTGGNTFKSALPVNGGDGFDTEISFLNPNASFTTVYYGVVDRHSAKGAYGNSFYPSKIVTGSGKASFVTPLALYETKSSTNSVDSVEFINQKLSQIVGTGNGTKKRFTGYLSIPQWSATRVPDSVDFKVGTQKIWDDNAGNLGGDISGAVNYIDYSTGWFDFSFATAPVNGSIVNATYDVMYNPGSEIVINRTDYAYPLRYIATSTINASDTVMMYDSIQAKFAVGFNGKVWMTKGALDFSKIPKWFNIANISGTTEEMAWSEDGDILYVGTGGGNLYRIKNLSMVTNDSALFDATLRDSVFGASTFKVPNWNCKLVTTQIAGFGRQITNISVDPVDRNKIAVSLGNYGSSTYVYYSTTAGTCAASTGTTNFSIKQGTGATMLPAMPIYSIILEKTDPKRALVGTEYGVYATADITVADPVWTPENGVTGLFPNVPVFKLRQQRRDGSVVNNPYVIYAATHGRGAWRSETFKGPVTVGIKDPKGSKSTATESGLKVYPNPMNGEGTIAFELNSSDNIMISIYTLQGKLVNTIKAGKLNAGEQKIAVNTDELAKGTYFVSVDGTTIHAVSKFIVIK